MRLTWAVILCGFLLSAGFATEITDDQKKEIAQRIEELKKRLELTPAQEEKIRPLVQEEVQKLKAIRDKHAGDTSRYAKRQMLQEARPVRSHFREEMEKILSPEQMKEWDKIREEKKAELKERRKSKSG